MTQTLEQTSKYAITKALAACASGKLAVQARTLLTALGYGSDKYIELEPPTATEFVRQFGKVGAFDQSKALTTDWLYADIVCQVAEDEIKLGKQLTMFSSQFEKGLYQSFLFVAVELSKPVYTRSELATITRQINKLFPMPVSLIFKHGQTLTISIVTHRPNRKDQNRDVLEKVTLIKDIRLANPHRAHLEILYDLSLEPLFAREQVRNFDHLQKAWQKTLDVSELNKRFFKEVADWYFWAIKVVKFPEGDNAKIEERNATAVIRLITRLIFVWFLKEKGLIKDELFIRRELEQVLISLDDKESTYYQAILQNLFFATLNQEMERRKFRNEGQNYNITNLFRYKSYFKQPALALDSFKDVPFLNGGLFECLDKPDKADPKQVLRIDGFSDRPDNALFVPNLLFFSGDTTVDLNSDYGTKGKRYNVRGLLNILDRYKFTIDENTPIEEEVALDPELLGKVFENLLAAYNPETGTTARKQTGSFYTPREIVNYMVDEVLIAYLADALFPGTIPHPTTFDRLHQLFDFNNNAYYFYPTEIEQLIRAIDNLKIIDPACGSGAFPMGILARLVFLLRRLDPDNKAWKQRQLDRLDELITASYRLDDSNLRDLTIQSLEKQKVDVEEAFARNELDYGRKLFLIQNCIYGVDIQPIAVQIAKLRCFIALIVDQKIDDTRPNRNVRPLPNLETKFVAANALLALERPVQLSFRDPRISKLENELADVRKSHFTARTPDTKRRYQDKDALLRAEIRDLLIEGGWASPVAEKLADWDPYDHNIHASFFDPEWMFNVTEGFDIVIGNPPYVRGERLKPIKAALMKEHKEVADGSADLYVYFYAQGFKLLQAGGRLAYISSNKFFRADYGKALRHFFTNKVRLETVIDFGDLPIFEATAYPCIVIGAKPTPNSNLKQNKVKTLTIKDIATIEHLQTVVDNTAQPQPQTDLSDEGWSLGDADVLNLLAKIKAAGESFEKHVKDKFYRGVTTGYNQAFIIDASTRDRLIFEDVSSKEVIKPYLRGRDVKQYKYRFANLYIIFTRRGIDIEKYPAIKKYLSQFRENLEPRGSENQLQGRKPGIYKWYEIQDSTAYYQEFDKPKIIYPDISPSNNFVFDVSKTYIDATLFFIPTNDLWLVALLNSPLAEWFIRQISSTIRGGYLRFKTIYVGQIPIATPGAEERVQIEAFVKQLIEYGTEVPEAAGWQAEIDRLVYRIYNLTAEEIALVEGKL